MKQERKQSAERGRAQTRVRAQLRTERVRQGYDEADLPAPDAWEPGLVCVRDPETPREVRDFPQEDDGVTLPQLLRSRRAIVPFHLSENAGRIDVAVVSSPRTGKVREAYEELAGFLRTVFMEKPPEFSAEEWHALLWGAGVTPAQRLILLVRLAIAADTRITDATVPFTPNDRSLKRFQAKFAALPDGTPFSLRLLLRDQRGKRTRRKGRTSGLLVVPDPLLLIAVRKVLEIEAEQKKARTDYEIGPLLHRSLAEMGVGLTSVPSEEEVRTLRERRAWRALALFPKAAARQRSYSEPAGEVS